MNLHNAQFVRSVTSVIFLSCSSSFGVKNSFMISIAPLSEMPNLPFVPASCPRLTVARQSE